MRLLTAVATAVLVFGVACNGDDGEEPPVGGGTVAVTLQEFAVLPATSSIAAGDVTFEATNEGPDDPHELVIIRTDLDPADLPAGDDGGVNETGEGIEVIDEIEEFPVGETESLTVELDAGAYALICNVVEIEDGVTEAHYQLGMRTAFTVT
jgi:plastocyanin